MSFRDLLKQAKTVGQISGAMGRMFQSADSQEARTFQARQYLSVDALKQCAEDKIGELTLRETELCNALDDYADSDPTKGSILGETHVVQEWIRWLKEASK
jgi:hypothetical protein